MSVIPKSGVDSPGRLAWRKLRAHKSALFGGWVIIVAIFLAIFCYVLVPDKSENSNAMHLEVSLLPPGSAIDFLVLPPAGIPQNTSLLKNWWSGKAGSGEEVPVAAHAWRGDTLQLTVFGYSAGDPDGIRKFSRQQLQVRFGHDMNPDDVLVHRTYWLGTDRFGRDLLSRLVVATRVSLSVGLIAVFISLVIGIMLGAAAGFFRGNVDKVIQWFINVIWSIPTLLLVVAITLALGKGFIQVFIAVGLTMWVEVARLVRGQFFSLRELQFVEAGRALGFTNVRIIFRHILPNVIGPVIVVAASNFASAILLEAGLSFLGMGAQPPTPSWGMMIKENYAYIVMDAAWLAVFPGMAIALMVLSFTLLGNGLRDAFDTKS